ncbi:MAG: glycerophosphodiester phosphodiesterase [Deltaproteobacteria bacterium]|nr:MAG: glycerophosphodiester phosphodiesterase [Deltaproteobacteria bacterium]
MAHPFFALRRPLAIGHRGCAGEVPENTIASFARAVADRAVVIETDVHLTRDGVPVLIHDDDVERISDGHGAVRDLDFAEVRRLDAGFQFRAPDGSTPFRGGGLRIPSLVEALGALPGMRFNLELKEDRPEIAERVLAVVRDAGREPLTLVTSGEDALMEKLRTAVRDSGARVALGASTGDVARFVRAAHAGAPPPPGPMALQIPAQFAGAPLVTSALIAAAHAADIHVHVWTINDPHEIAALLELGVDGVISDFPARVVRAAASFSA